MLIIFFDKYCHLILYPYLYIHDILKAFKMRVYLKNTHIVRNGSIEGHSKWKKNVQHLDNLKLHIIILQENYFLLKISTFIAY